jgi:CDP-glucose 4,6-dehydratase
MFGNAYCGKRALVTGHTGFKGGWLSLWLHKLGAEVWGLSLPPIPPPNLHEIVSPRVFAGEVDCDIRNIDGVTAALDRIRPQIIFHLAAQPLVRRSYSEPMLTLETNVVGTANLLEAVRRLELNCVLVIITTDKCYENREWEFAYRENDPLGGYDLYSASKAATELVAQAWNRSFFLSDRRFGPMATVRAGNVIGGGDYAEDRIVPDCVRALTRNEPIPVRNPKAIRPWQHVLDCLSGYLWLGARLSQQPKSPQLAGAFNFGPEPSARQPVRKLVEDFLTIWPGRWIDCSDPKAVHEATLLSLSIEKAAAVLGWLPVWDFKEAVRRTALWYRQRHALKEGDIFEYSRTQIDDYVAAACSRALAWTQPE